MSRVVSATPITEAVDDALTMLAAGVPVEEIQRRTKLTPCILEIVINREAILAEMDRDSMTEQRRNYRASIERRAKRRDDDHGSQD